MSLIKRCLFGVQIILCNHSFQHNNANISELFVSTVLWLRRTPLCKAHPAPRSRSCRCLSSSGPRGSPRARWMPAACSTKRPTVVRRFRSSVFGIVKNHLFTGFSTNKKVHQPSDINYLPTFVRAPSPGPDINQSSLPTLSLVGGGICIDRAFCAAKIMLSRASGRWYRAICSNSFIAPAHRFFHSF